MHSLLVALATETPLPTPEVDPNLVTPGPVGFAAIAFVALAVVVLVWDMLRRIRRGRYRSEIREDLDAEELATSQAQEAERATETDDQDISRDGDAQR